MQQLQVCMMYVSQKGHCPAGMVPHQEMNLQQPQQHRQVLLGFRKGWGCDRKALVSSNLMFIACINSQGSVRQAS